MFIFFELTIKNFNFLFNKNLSQDNRIENIHALYLGRPFEASLLLVFLQKKFFKISEVNERKILQKSTKKKTGVNNYF